MSADRLPGSAGSGKGPAARYEAILTAGTLARDPGQGAVVDALEALHRQLCRYPQRPTGFWERVRTRFRAPEPPPVGLYLWGSVGRGKTLLMDLFYDSLPSGMGIRVHFHRFMHRVHGDLKRLQGQTDPLRAVAERFAADARVLCFDEFFVSDIGDAMILAEVLRHLFDRGVTLVATSNVEPSGLYANGLQRRRFLPAIDLLETKLRVLELHSPTDYRLRALQQAELYHSPLDAAAQQGLLRSFRSLALEVDEDPEPLLIEGRPIPVRAVAPGVVWFDFATLCEGPRSQVDYIELAREFHTVLLEGVPQLDGSRDNAARRFIALVDEFYDRGVKLVISAAVPLLELYRGEKWCFEFERTRSRLIEMQSEAYLTRLHLA